MLFARDPVHRRRTLTASERRACLHALRACDVAPRAVCERAVALARIHVRAPRIAEVRGPRSLVAHAALVGRADGIALGTHVFVRSALTGPRGALPIDLVAHEVTHVAQALRDGLAPFLLRYAAAYARGRARGLGDHGAYLAIPYEQEARRVEAVARWARGR